VSGPRTWRRPPLDVPFTPGIGARRPERFTAVRVRSGRLPLLWALIMTAAVGCILEDDDAVADAGAPAGDAAPADGGADADALVPEAWMACEAAADCVVFETACCDHCNGGAVASVNAAFEAEARAQLVDTRCDGVSCSTRGCAPEVPTCEAGRCGSMPDPAWGMGGGCATLDEAACEASASCRPIRGAPAEEVCIEDFSAWNSVYAGCMAADAGCGDAETCAQVPDSGRRMVFPSTCVPSGWVGCNTQPCDVAGACEDSASAPPGRLCVEGGADGRVVVTVQPEGCFSSSCTVRADVFCRADADGDTLEVEANFCFRDAEGPGDCTADCGGGGTARCLADLAPGAYTARLGDVVVAFQHPGLEVCGEAGP
jgi:hypothetical protein